MAKFIKTDKVYQKLLLTVDLSKQIIFGSFEYIISKVIDQVDTSIFDENIKNDLTGRPAYNPKILLKIILYAYSIGVFYSRKIARLCIDNITMIALSENTTPDFTLIAAFISNNKDEIINLFQKVLLVCEKNNLLGHTTFALDGCKLSSNASKEWSGTFDELRNKAEKLKNKLNKIIELHELEDTKEQTEEELEKYKQTNLKLNSSIKKIEDFLNYEEKKEGTRNNEIKSNITDNESAKMQTGHGVVQGYNGQALVDDKHQVIIGAEVFGTGPDNDLLEPMLDNTLCNMKSLGKAENYFEGKTFLADTGYFSENNLKEASDKKIDAYIPDQQFRKRDVRFKDKDKYNPKKNDKFGKEDFIYDSKKECFICPNNCELKKEGKENKIKNFYYQKYIAKQKNCTGCKLRKKCLRNEKTKKRTLMFQVKEFDREYTKEMIAKIDTQLGRKKYSMRMGIVEPVFANIRIHKRLDRFTLRGKHKVNNQWLLFCIVHNIGKIMKYGELKTT